jgi:membrane protein DedA with SNARE-associated domain
VVLASVSGSIVDFIGNHGVYAVFVLMAIDAVFPAASELVLVYAGALASGGLGQDVTLFGTTISHGASAYVVLALAATLGYLVGAIIGWFVGYFGGRPLVERYGHLVHLGPKQFGKAERWFDSHGVWSVFVGRLLPVIRSFISIPAGVFRFPFWPYVLWTLLGSAVWSFALAGVGYALGANWEKFHNAFRYVDYFVVAVAILIIGLFVARLVRNRNAEHPAR